MVPLLLKLSICNSTHQGYNIKSVITVYISFAEEIFCVVIFFLSLAQKKFDHT